MQFAFNCLFLCLNGVESLGSAEASELLQRGLNDWLQHIPPVQEDLLHASNRRADQNRQTGSLEKDGLRLKQERFELQTVSLLRMLFEFSGGHLEGRQHRFGTGDRDFTVGQNARLCGSVFGVDWSKPFGRFDPKAMHSALSRSVLVSPSEENALEIPDTVGWRCHMMRAVPVGFPEGHLVR